MVTLPVNGTSRTVDVDADTPLLWVLRDDLRLTGTKFGCGVAQCGACTVHIDGQAARSPGGGREPAPGTQEAFGALVQAWRDTGAVCPGS